MYQSGYVVAHFKGLSIFLEATTQHPSRQKEDAIYCPCKVCNNNVMYLYQYCELIYEHLLRSGFINNYFMWTKHSETQLRAEENMTIPDHVYSQHDNGGQPSIEENMIVLDHSDESLDIEELMHNVVPELLKSRTSVGH
jgi:hypothetical protein